MVKKNHPALRIDTGNGETLYVFCWVENNPRIATTTARHLSVRGTPDNLTYFQAKTPCKVWIEKTAPQPPVTATLR